MARDMPTRFSRSAILAVSLPFLCCLCASAHAQSTAVPFDSDAWAMDNAVRADHLGRPSLMGFATLKGLEFRNGVIEVDIAVTGARSYPGIVFRMQGDGDFERVYIRPHVAGVFDNAIQYAPSFNGIEGWQLYNGTGYTAGVELPRDAWVHVKLEVNGTRARLFVGDMERPALVVTDLKRGDSAGGIGLMGPADKSAYFSNFSYRADDRLDFGPAPFAETPPGVIRPWQLSRIFDSGGIDMERYPSAEVLGDAAWQTVTSEPSGLVDVARHVEKTDPAPGLVFAKTIIEAGRDTLRKLEFGYSDAVVIFLNGTNVFSGDNSYRLRDASFQGIVGCFDAVYLPLRKGSNELVFALAESFGGWGFTARLGDAVYGAPGVEKLWETGRAFAVPECVVHDAGRNALYVSNYDGYHRGVMGKQFISKLSLDGKMVEAEWAGGVTNPTGMAVAGDRLYVVMRAAVGEIDIASRQIVKRHFMPGAAFPNDIAVDDAGTMYVTDSFKNCIYRIAGGACEEWLAGPAIARPNGILLDDGALVVGCNAECALKSIDLATKEIRTIARWPSGTIDGISAAGGGDMLVSHNEGRLYRVSRAGAVTKILDTSVLQTGAADFAYMPGSDMVVIPTFESNTVAAYRVRF